MDLILILIIVAIVAWLSFTLGQNNKKQIPSIVIDTRAESSNVAEEPFDYEDKDNWEKFNFHSAQLVPAGGRYNITYMDQRNLITNRDITIKRAYNDNNKFAFDAHCHLRNSHRSFIDERISKGLDLETGEIINSVAQHSISKYENTRENKMWTEMGKETISLFLLSYVCRADGRMLKSEREIVADFVRRRCNGKEFDPEELDKAIKNLGNIEYKEFKRFISKMKSSGDLDKLKDITDCAKRIVDTQKIIDPLERVAIDILEEAIKT